MDVFVGTILPWSTDWAPEGWQLCQGQLLTISQYNVLYAVIGTKFGGDGVNNFALPDLRGRFPVGIGQSPYSGVEACNLGDVHNSTGQVTLVQGNLPPHTHSITNTVKCSGGGSVSVSLPINIPVNADTTAALTNVPTNNMLAQGKAGTNVANIYTSSTPTTNATLKSFNAQGSINVPDPTVTVTSTCSDAGGAQPVTSFDIRPHSLCINYIIAVTGIYPAKP
jgi:microcystin-dependent protein